jgi:ubiquinone/menaquinone biosynthesis C-methylase UbiE
MDQSAEMVTKTRKNYKHVEVISGSALYTPYDYECMDLILCIGVSEYIADIDALLGEILRVLKIGGFAIITSSPLNYLNYIRNLSGHKLHLRSEIEMTSRISAGKLSILKTNHTLIQDHFLLTKHQ